MHAEPAFRTFLLDGQTVLVEDYLRVRPERESDVRTLVKSGRLQVGPWYVLADELIPSGESLIRNLLLGTADAERLGGRLDVLYCPDAFGHPAVLRLATQPDDQVLTTLEGRIDAGAMSAHLSESLSSRFKGATDWSARGVRRGSMKPS